MAEKKFDEMVKSYLTQKAQEDAAFAVTFAKPNKSIEECIRYIFGEARKQAVNNCAAITDAEVFGWAVHYYDEDDIKVDAVPGMSATVKTGESKPTAAAVPAQPYASSARKGKTAQGDIEQPILLSFD